MSLLNALLKTFERLDEMYFFLKVLFIVEVLRNDFRFF